MSLQSEAFSQCVGELTRAVEAGEMAAADSALHALYEINKPNPVSHVKELYIELLKEHFPEMLFAYRSEDSELRMIEPEAVAARVKAWEEKVRSGWQVRTEGEYTLITAPSHRINAFARSLSNETQHEVIAGEGESTLKIKKDDWLKVLEKQFHTAQLLSEGTSPALRSRITG